VMPRREFARIESWNCPMDDAPPRRLIPRHVTPHAEPVRQIIAIEQRARGPST
jgi:hypothetical protein